MGRKMTPNRNHSDGILKRSSISRETANLFLSALLNGDRHACWAIVKRQLDEGMSISDLYIKLFQPALYLVGELWERNAISVATEHMATAIIEAQMSQLYPQFVSPHPNGCRSMVTTVEGETHRVGARMVCDFFEMHGWDGQFLGSDIPQRELIRLIRESPPDILGISFTMFFNYGLLCDMLDDIQTEFPDLKTLIGGQAARRVDSRIRDQFPDVSIIRSLKDLERFLSSYPAPQDSTKN